MNSLYTIKQPDFRFCDERGCLNQLVHDGYKQINVLESYSGVARGGHYHKETKEAFFIVSGSVEVSLMKDDEAETVLFSKNDFFEIAPYVVHSMFFPEDCVMLAMYDKPVERADGSKDIYSADKGKQHV